MLQSSLSGLRAFQRALATTSNNVANAATDGYVRQRVDFSSRPAGRVGNAFIGNGVQIADVRRIYDGFLTSEVRGGQSSNARLETLHSLSERTGDLLGSESGGLSGGLQNFFESVQGLTNDPASTPVRQTLLGQAESLAQRFSDLNGRLDALDRESTTRMSDSADTINRLAESIADINRRIGNSPGASQGQFPPDLLDERDRLLSQLSKEVDVDVVEQDMGKIDVSIGSGQTLVLGNRASTLSVEDGRFGRTDPQVRLDGVVVTNQVSGGKLGGLIDFRQEVLAPVQNDLGRAAVALADEFNAQHRQGMDLNGNLGGDFFAVGAPEVNAATGNTGTAELDVAITDPAALSGDDYQARFDGTEWSLLNTSTGQTVATDPDGNFSIDGMEIEVGSGAAAAGDSFRIRPTRNAAEDMSLLINRPEEIAAAFPLSTGADIGNTGNAEISGGEILDIDDPDLLEEVNITFIDANTYEIDGNTFTYTSGDDIDVNGWRVQISGTPAAGDEFTVGSNTGGAGDNRNALAMADVRDNGILEGGQRSIVEQADAMLADIGGTTAAAQTALESGQAQLAASQEALESVSGVNLEEEAADLMRFQQAYEANARVVQTANTIFQSLLQAVGR
ncbi:flagellar hook-associated protein FlgK [Wenzhouxiangella sp. AB-CW3]|uniref:flagellar hook-associated protein FlgK n=1 Tax=Wenzhouxiangella sp. AB-CW3 TaxID=2771012 RepID=UPI00168B80F6|nr:flagellar hook-associated protein FlgK [Wenzhouxiangella sp. AB-CW3]QOC21220.1 flagellar hook-associated protein FlgK [Wenzhouxiangella sp. AB-CW3]